MMLDSYCRAIWLPFVACCAIHETHRSPNWSTNHCCASERHQFLPEFRSARSECDFIFLFYEFRCVSLCTALVYLALLHADKVHWAHIDLSLDSKCVGASIQAHTPNMYTRNINEMPTNGNMEKDPKCKRQYNPIDERQKCHEEN